MGADRRRMGGWVFHFDRGQVNGTDVAGIDLGFLGHLPGNVFDGNVKLLLGSPAYPGNGLRYEMADAEHGMDFTAGQSTQSEFHYVTA